MHSARALRAKSRHGSEVPACPRRRFAFRVPPFPDRFHFNERSLCNGRRHHRGRPIVGGHAVVVGGIMWRAAAMRGRIVRTAGDAGAQQQGNSQNTGHFAIVSGTKGWRTSAGAPRVYPQRAFRDAVSRARASLVPIREISPDLRYYGFMAEPTGRLPWTVNRSRAWSGSQ